MNKLETIQAYKDANMKLPFYLTDEKYWKSNKITECKKCKDTSFELIENKKNTGKCCRCGLKYVSNK